MAFNNTIEHAKIFTQALDEVAQQESVTSWTEANASQVKYNGGNTVMIPEMALDGLANYDRQGGYADGAVDFKFVPYTLDYDRGKRFLIDDMDVDETNFVETAGLVMGEFTRVHTVPEVDAVRIAQMAEKGKIQETVEAGKELEAFKGAIVKIRDKGANGQLVAHVSYAFLNELELRFAQQLSSVTFSVNGVDTTFPSIDGVALIPTTSDKMNTKVTLSENGWAPAGDKIEFVIAPQTAVLGIMKHNVKRIISPEDNQTHDGYLIPTRVYHGVIIPANKAELIAVGKLGE